MNIGLAQDIIARNLGSDTVRWAIVQYDRARNPGMYSKEVAVETEELDDIVFDIIQEYGERLIGHGDVVCRIQDDDDSTIVYRALYNNALIAHGEQQFYDWCLRHYVDVALGFTIHQELHLAKKIVLELEEKRALA